MITRGPVALGAGAFVVETTAVAGPRRDADFEDPEEHPPDVIATSIAATTTAPVDAKRWPPPSMVAIPAPRVAAVVIPIVARMLSANPRGPAVAEVEGVDVRA
jgi:hypothetical protein